MVVNSDIWTLEMTNESVYGLIIPKDRVLSSKVSSNIHIFFNNIGSRRPSKCSRPLELDEHIWWGF